MDGKGRYQDNIFVERLWRTVKYEEVSLEAHQALGYRTPAEVFYGESRESNRRMCSPKQETQSLAGEPGFSLNSALILSK